MFRWQSLIGSWHYSTYTPILCFGEHPTPADMPTDETLQFLQPSTSKLPADSRHDKSDIHFKNKCKIDIKIYYLI